MSGFVSGLVCGEGNFTIAISRVSTTRLGYHIRPIFQIELHRNDEQLLKTLQEFFGFGSISYPKPRTRFRNESPTCRYSVTAMSHCVQLVDFFHNNPVVGVKQNAFEIWAECLEIIREGKHTRSEGFKRIVELRSTINQIRRPSTFRDFDTLLTDANNVEKSRQLAQWLPNEEALVRAYLAGNLTRLELEGKLNRNTASLSNKITRMRKQLRAAQ